MEYIYLGKIVNTHGIKGEIRIISDFDKKAQVFNVGFNIYIGEEKIKEVINSYRKHKNYDMITLKNINNINDVLKYKGKNVYILREDLSLNNEEVLLSELINYKIINNNICYGKVLDIYKNKNSILLYIKYKKNYYIPYLPEFINKIDKNKKEILVLRVGELL